MGHVRWENSRRLTAQVITVHISESISKRLALEFPSSTLPQPSNRYVRFCLRRGERGPYYRGFAVSELLQNGDALLDIGVEKDSSRFFAQRCSYVDAGNIAPAAIEAARRYNSSTNIRYHLLDPVGKQFPRGPSRMKRSDKLCQRPLVCDVGEDPKESLGRGNVRRVRITATRGTLSSAIPFPNLSGGSLHHELYPGLE
jgi:hypothetical protein